MAATHTENIYHIVRCSLMILLRVHKYPLDITVLLNKNIMCYQQGLVRGTKDLLHSYNTSQILSTWPGQEILLTAKYKILEAGQCYLDYGEVSAFGAL